MATQFTTNVNAPYPQHADPNWDVPLNSEIFVYDLKLGSTYFQPLSNVSPIIYTASSTVGAYVPTQYQNIRFTGVLTQNIIIQFPSGVGGAWFIENFTTGAFTITLQVGSGPSGTTYSPPQGYRSSIRSDGINIDQGINVPFWIVAPTIPNNTVIANTSGGVAQPSPVNPSTLKFTSGLNMDGGTITNVATPINPTDGVNKSYVDTTVNTAIQTIHDVPSSKNLYITNNTGSPNTQLDITTEWVMMVNATNNGLVRTSISVTVDASVTGVNGLDVGSQTANTWYYIFLIDNGTTTASLLSLSETSPTLPGGYTYVCRVGAIFSNVSNQFRVYDQVGNVAQYRTILQISSITGTFSISNFIPPTSKIIRALITAGPTSDSTVFLAAVSGQPILRTFSIAGAAGIGGCRGDLVLPTTNVIFSSSGVGTVQCIGWIDSVLSC